MKLMSLTLGLSFLVVATALGRDVGRQEVLKLNEAQGDELMNAKLESLRQDEGLARQYVAVGLSLAKEADPPLNYTSAYVLGVLAREQKNFDATRAFFRICIDRATMLQSDRKLALGHLQLLATSLENERPDDAQKVLEEFLKSRTPEDVVDDVIVDGDAALTQLIEALAKDPAKANQLIASAAKLVKEVKPLNYAAVYVLAYLAREVKNVDASKTFFRLCLDETDRILMAKVKEFQARGGGSQDEEDDLVYADRKLAILFMDLIDLLYESKKFDEAEKVCKELLEKRGGNAVAKRHALLRLVQASATQGRLDDAFRQLQPFLRAAPNDPEVMQINAWLLWQAERYDESAKVYEKVRAAIDDEDTKDRITYRLSHLYTESGDIDKATEQLQALLKKDPNNATYNNDLGYVWADHDRNLDEAEKLVQKALDKDPTSGAYLDSMGWVLYKKGEFQKAKEFLQKAIQDPEAQHAELYDHLGDIHWKLGEKDDAVSAWKKALDLVGTGKRDQKRKVEIDKKLKENK